MLNPVSPGFELDGLASCTREEDRLIRDTGFSGSLPWHMPLSVPSRVQNGYGDRYIFLPGAMER